MKIYPSNVIDDINENYIVGVLASEKDNLPRLGETQEPITILRDGDDVLFYIKPLSTEPKEVTKTQRETYNMTDYYIGFASKVDITNIPSHNIKYLNIDEKIDFLRKNLEGKLILFNPLLIQDQKRERYHKNISKLLIEDDFWEEGIEYIPVPNFDMDQNDFEDLLFSEESIELAQYNRAMPFPHYLRCGDFIYGNIRENNWRIDSAKNNKTFLLIETESIKRVKITTKEIDKYIGPEREHLSFFADNFLNSDIADRMEDEGVPLLELKKRREMENVALNKEAIEIDQSNNRKNSNDTTIKVNFERDFIDHLELKAKSQNLVYSRQDLVNFHTSIKSSAFTILSGQSGIGKTRLATLYGEALDLSQNKGNMLIMPISPAYTEPSDILGFLNPNTGLYIPSDTGLVDFLLRAEENKDQVHMLLLDEMNLSQVEHYFSPFISLLELNIQDRNLSLYSEGSICHNDQKYPSSIRIEDNLIIVGTMNTDETTKDLSDRLLDRSSVVVLEKNSFVEIKNEISKKASKDDINMSEKNELAYGEAYINWKSKKDEWEAFDIEELHFFDKVDKEISKVDPQKSFSIRNIIRMGNYLNNIPVNANGDVEIKKEKAIDLFIKQRVITKLRGPIEIYESLIGTAGEDEVNDGKLIKLFSNSDISEFEYTIKELRRKAKELHYNGYAT